MKDTKLPCRDCHEFHLNGRSNKHCYEKCEKLRLKIGSIESRWILTDPSYTLRTQMPVHS